MAGGAAILGRFARMKRWGGALLYRRGRRGLHSSGWKTCRGALKTRNVCVHACQTLYYNCMSAGAVEWDGGVALKPHLEAGCFGGVEIAALVYPQF